MANEIIKGAGFHHIALRTSDLNRSLKFYTEVLGFQKIAQWGEGDREIAMVDIGDGSRMELFAGGIDMGQKCEPRQPGTFFHLAFGVDSVDDAYQRAIDCGAQSQTPPKDVEMDAKPEPFRARLAFVIGPDGEQIEFFKYRD